MPVVPDTISSIPLTAVFATPLSCVGRFYYSVSILSTLASGTENQLFAGCQPWNQGTLLHTHIAPEYAQGPCLLLTHKSKRAYIPRYAVKGVLPQLPEIKSGCSSVFAVSGFSSDSNGCQSLLTTPTPVLMALAVVNSVVYTRLSAVTASHEPTTVFWRNADLSLFTDDVASTRRNIETTLASTTASSTPAGSATSQPNARGLSRGAKIGVRVGVRATRLLISTIILCYVWRKHVKPPGMDGSNNRRDATMPAELED